MNTLLSNTPPEAQSDASLVEREIKPKNAHGFWWLPLIPLSILIIASIVVVILGITNGKLIKHYFNEMTFYMRAYPLIAPCIAILTYVVLVPLTMPISYFAIGFGFAFAHCYKSMLFGFIVAYVTSMTGIEISAFICFYLGKTYFGKFIEE